MKESVLNKLIILTAAVFFLFSIALASIEASTKASLLSELNLLSNQFDAENNEANGSSSDQENNTETQRMFNNGVDAFLHGYYEGFINQPSYKVRTSGETQFTANLSVGTVKISTFSSNLMIKYEDGSTIYELLSYEPDTGSGRTYGRTSGQFIFYSAREELVFLKQTDNVAMVGNDLHADYGEVPWQFADAEEFQSISGMSPGQSVYNYRTKNNDNSYLINVDETTYIERNRGGRLAYYDVGVEATGASLSRATSTFRRVINYFAGSDSSPRVTEMKAYASIDAEGNISLLRVHDKYNLVTRVGDLVNVSVSAIGTATYDFIQMGGEIDYPKPAPEEAYPYQPNK